MKTSAFVLDTFVFSLAFSYVAFLLESCFVDL